MSMWNSVSRAVSYGWRVGLTVLRKMSDKIFETTNEDDDISTVTDKMSEKLNPFEMKKTSEQMTNLREKQNSDSDHPSLETIQAAVLFDSLDETLPISNAAGWGPKKTNKATESYVKVAFPKSDNRARQKMYPDVPWNPVGNGTEYKWYNNDKLEKSQSDLSSSKWFSNADNSVKSDFSHRSVTHTLNSSESDIFPSRSRISTNPSESYSQKSPFLFKSSSSSQLPPVRVSYVQSNRPWKYSGNSTGRPISVISMCDSIAPNSSNTSSHKHTEGMHAFEKTSRLTESVLSLTENAETPEGLSWRRLHMSRAKLKATATTSELLSGFAMVAMVELQINKPTAVPEWLFVLFAVCTTILVSVHIFALMISTYLLPNIDAVSKLHVSSLVTESPHDRMKSFIELAWAFSTILGLFLFLVEIAILCWVKFWDYSFTAAMSATMIIMPVLVMFVAFAMHFYHSLVVIKCKTSVSNMQELENMKRQLDNVSSA